MDKVIAVDLDEVLSETARALLKRNRYRINGNKLHWEDLVSYNLREIPGLNVTKIQGFWIYMRFLIGAGLWNKIKPVSGAKTKLKEFKKKGYKLHVVTARHFLLRFATGVWLYFNYKHIFSSIEFANFFTRFSTKKSEICKKIGADFIIEDNLENAIDCANAGVKVYLIDKPWNQGYDKKKHKGIVKIYSRSEIDI
ncbi:MAG TPA: hypothetical protein P5060_01930 [Candidatus Absconditabacterales bacterium]|nr:hypothetical protein [Candidatus Absconditabacterales bacterium]